MKTESFVLIALMMSSVALMGTVRVVNALLIPGIGPTVINSVPIHLGLVALQKACKWYSNRGNKNEAT